MKLHKYQERAIKFCLEKKRVYLAIDLGMGKTAIALKVIEKTKQPALVLGPLRPIYTTWPDEIKKWTPQLSYKILHGPDKSLVGTEDIDILLMNYEGLKWLAKQKYRWKKRLVIFDESSMCKSHSTERFRILKKMSPLWTDHRICLSATPAPNSLKELWSQYYLLDRGAALGKNISEFRRRYCYSFSYPGMAFTEYKVDSRFTNDIYKQVQPQTYRLESKDYLELPPILYNVINCELTPTLMRQYKELEQNFFLELEESEVEAFSTATLSMKLRQFIQGGIYDENKIWISLHEIKVKALKELVETAAGNPILCAIQFKGELAMIQNIFPSAPVIAGQTTPKEATKYIKQWNSGELALLLCHPASLSHGVNLQMGGSTLLWYGLTWSLEQYLQLNGRLHRQGQKKPVVIHHLVMKETIDEAVVKALQIKDMNQQKFLDYIKEYTHGIL